MEDFKEQDKYLRAKKRVEKIKGFYIHLAVYLIINGIITASILINVEWSQLNFWMFSTAFWWGIGLAFHAYGIFGQDLLFTKAWQERKINEIMEKEDKEFWN